ncbi:PIG-L deacetylase family protein [Streptomyces sp. NPDC051172]|uniref:PIG-L deacetylase family protein n=1 Tax=Streptomyces sp. NPDC051172 TaxID=3155796 RepID=UPI003445838E
MPLPSLLAVFAHPDDESLSAGGVLAQHAASGARTAVVTATWAEGTWRAAELAEALRILGAGKPRMMGYADARVPESAPGAPRFCDVPLDEAVGQLVAHIREFKPDIVVTHDAYGGLSGHPDHVRAHRVTVLAVHAAGRPSALYLATHPDSAVRALGRDILLRPGRAVYSVPDAWIAVAADVGPWVEQKLDAIMAHRSEVKRGALPGRLAALPAAERARVMSTEWYIRYGALPPVEPSPGFTP